MAVNSPKRQRRKFGAVARTLLMLLAVVAASCTQPTGDGTPPDTTAPTVSATSSAPDPTTTSPIPVTIVFSEVVTGFVDTDLVLGNALASNFNNTNNPTFTVDLYPSVSGSVTLDIPAGACSDAAGNPNTALAPTFTRTYSP
jgi:hypothetical protein